MEFKFPVEATSGKAFFNPESAKPVDDGTPPAPSPTPMPRTSSAGLRIRPVVEAAGTQAGVTDQQFETNGQPVIPGEARVVTGGQATPIPVPERDSPVFVAGRKKKSPQSGEPVVLPEGVAPKPAAPRSLQDPLTAAMIQVATEAQKTATEAVAELGGLVKRVARLEVVTRYLLTSNESLTVQCRRMAWMARLQEYTLSGFRGKPMAPEIVEKAKREILQLDQQVRVLHQRAQEAYDLLRKEHLLDEPAPQVRREKSLGKTAAAFP